MVSSAQMDDNRTVVCNIALTATYKFASFHAMVWLEYVSEPGHLLGRSQEWQQDCGPAPLFGAAHANGTFTEIAPSGTHEIRLVQTAQYQLNFANIVGVIKAVFDALGLGSGSGPVQLPQGPDGDTTVDPPDWADDPALNGAVSVVQATA
jgi:hypothetical protein